MKQGTQKAKGNSFENQIAKQLGKWIFSDEGVFQRHLTSGAQKISYNGDIVPAKLELIKWDFFPFLIELKIGYKNNIPNLNNQTIIRKWLDKLLLEKTKNQFIIWLIVRFHNHSTLLITDFQFSNIYSSIIINHINNNNLYNFYIYNFNELLELNFYNLYKRDKYLYNIFNKDKL